MEAMPHRWWSGIIPEVDYGTLSSLVCMLDGDSTADEDDNVHCFLIAFSNSFLLRYKMYEI